MVAVGMGWDCFSRGWKVKAYFAYFAGIAGVRAGATKRQKRHLAAAKVIFPIPLREAISYADTACGYPATILPHFLSTLFSSVRK
jgi:hypothetical protein